MAGVVGACLHGAHREVALHRVAGLEGDIEIVEFGVVRIPQVRIAERERNLGVRLAGDASGDRALVARGGGELGAVRRRAPSGAAASRRDPAIMASSSTCCTGTGSIHTVCQMPVTAVYQMPFGLSTCLPRGMQRGIGGVPDGDHEFLRARRV